jgi:hypothetical protein
MSIPEMNIPREFCFDFINNPHNKEMISTAYEAIHELELWQFMKDYNKPFHCVTDDKFYNIYEKIQELGYDGHSGVSFALTLREMKKIADHGIEKYKECYNN